MAKKELKLKHEKNVKRLKLIIISVLIVGLVVLSVWVFNIINDMNLKFLPLDK